MAEDLGTLLNDLLHGREKFTLRDFCEGEISDKIKKRYQQSPEIRAEKYKKLEKLKHIDVGFLAELNLITISDVECYSDLINKTRHYEAKDVKMCEVDVAFHLIMGTVTVALGGVCLYAAYEASSGPNPSLFLQLISAVAVLLGATLIFHPVIKKVQQEYNNKKAYRMISNEPAKESFRTVRDASEILYDLVQIAKDKKLSTSDLPYLGNYWNIKEYVENLEDSLLHNFMTADDAYELFD